MVCASTDSILSSLNSRSSRGSISCADIDPARFPIHSASGHRPAAIASFSMVCIEGRTLPPVIVRVIVLAATPARVAHVRALHRRSTSTSFIHSVTACRLECLLALSPRTIGLNRPSGRSSDIGILSFDVSSTKPVLMTLSWPLANLFACVILRRGTPDLRVANCESALPPARRAI